ncbi:MAG: aldehyde ferredoxin oxidoreductase family protein [Candidatus Hermodarchaeota archaeon]|nr:aldehyde ferredoxin oxidoreductase family protein [Candidatus Hermodarchaeota archaeon]
MYKGYAGKILRIDLTSQKVTTESTSQDLARRFIGGTGYAGHLLYHEIPKGVDPLGPENKLYFCTGPATGTVWPTAGRMAVVSKSPLTGIWAESHVGGHLGPEIKYAGYDFIIIGGQAEKPTVLSIVDEKVEFHSGIPYWGQKTLKASKGLRKDLKQQHGHVALIGPGGENLVKYSAIMVDGARAAGRTGLGAVMGSKKLKAIVVRGTGSVDVADPQRFKALWEEGHQRVQENPQALEMRKYGTPILVATKQSIGELPTYNHREGVYEGWDRISAETFHDNYYHTTRACATCRLACKKAFKVEEGPYKGLITEGPEYEGIMAMGSNVGIDDIPTILQTQHLCNEYGLDVISAGCTAAFLMELAEHGLLSEEERRELDIQWGNKEGLVQLIQAIAERKGLGDLAAEGSHRIAKKKGATAEPYDMTVKGMEISGQDGRAHRSMALGHAVSARGADHLRNLVTMDQLAYKEVAAERFGEDKLPEICDPYVETHKALATVVTEKVYAIRDSLIVCWYTCSWPPIFWVEDFAPLLAAVTGEPAFDSIEEMMHIGARLVTLKRCFNVREGISRKDDRLPRRFTHEPFPSGPSKGQTVDLEPMLDEYYTLYDWDVKTGIPTYNTLQTLGLEDIAKDLKSQGVLPS